jgi:hypothetical protein
VTSNAVGPDGVTTASWISCVPSGLSIIIATAMLSSSLR